MAIDINRKISFTLKEYQKDYNFLLKDYLSKHEDFDEKQFIELEINFYNLCYNNANIIKTLYDGKYIYSVNGGLCEILIPAIYDNLVTLKDENDGWDIELSIKYKASFKKIIDYLKEKNELLLDIDSTRYHNLLSHAVTPEVKELLSNIFYKDISLFSVVNFINEKTNEKTYELFMNEFNYCFFSISSDFMLKVKHEDIVKALTYKNSLDYVYASEGDMFHVKKAIRKINNINTVFNIFGLSRIKTENSTRLVFLNELMMRYHNGISEDYIEGFEIINKLKNIYYYLNNLEDYTNELDDLEENDINTIPYKTDITNNYTKSTIEDYLCSVSVFIDTINYDILVNALYLYFTTSKFPLLEKKIIFKRVNKKKVGWALKEVYKNIKLGVLDLEYFRFAKDNINIFENEIIETIDFNKSKFYKVFTTNPDK